MKFFDNSLHFRLLSYKSHQHGKFKSRLHKNKNNKSPCPTAQVSAPTPEQTNSEPSPDKVAMLILKNIFKALVLQLPASSPSNAENEPFKPFFPRETFEEHECNKEVIVSSFLRMMRIMFGRGFVFRLLFAVAIPPFQSFLLTEICWCVQVVASTRHQADSVKPFRTIWNRLFVEIVSTPGACFTKLYDFGAILSTRPTPSTSVLASAITIDANEFFWVNQLDRTILFTFSKRIL